jgi:hypothetical protein
MQTVKSATFIPLAFATSVSFASSGASKSIALTASRPTAIFSM